MIYIYITLFLLFLFSSFRYEVGCDWVGYYNMYKKISTLDFSKVLTERDLFSQLIFYWTTKIGLPYPYVYIPFGLIFFWGIHMLAKRQPDPLGFLILLFPVLIIHMAMSGIRQASSIGIICIALTSFIDRRPIHYLLWVIFAAGIHSSAIIFLLLTPFTFSKFNNLNILIYGVISIPIILFLLTTDSAKYAANVYIGTIRESKGAIFRVGLLVLTALYFFLFLRKKWLETFPFDYVLIYIGAIGMILTFFLIPLSTIIADRFGYYFIPIQAIILARLPYLQFKSHKNLQLLTPYFILFITVIVWVISSWSYEACYIPYNNWLMGIPYGIN